MVKIAKAIQTRLAYALMDLASASNPPAVQSKAYAALYDLSSDLDRLQTDHGAWLSTQIQAFKDRAVTAVEPAKLISRDGW